MQTTPIPSEGMSLADALGVLGFILALVLGVAELWKRPKIKVHAQWAYASGDLKGLAFTVLNLGRRKGVITRVGYQATDDDGPENFASDSSIVAQLPLVLDIDGASPAFFFEIDDRLRDGRATNIVVEQQLRRGERRHVFPIPPQPEPDSPVLTKFNNPS